MSQVEARPSYVAEEHLKYLDDLRDSCAVSMHRAASCLQDEFDLDRATAAKIHGYWMRSYGDKNR